ncbi:MULTISPECIES: glycine cleavage system protein H [Chryseobacterium]|jgi:glycine cleavage system H protein|uniref:glycine cleavage system protein H n=1 Tax=Chryseobacterium TaxID=59732 RepID=UPI00195D34CF|nr:MULTISPECIES: glycine cleavage system protein H [Chryseobacterium]MBM7420279.1 glycine cleavage system H protein [Chryseobacterium sp. JUb44]MDH6210223.1 glycine cleavage system H protein [Chryseobacterium sp. BIGb0186]WSO08939.1 glycine cleavage system protein H [Chryseobacterium scophthalmum]
MLVPKNHYYTENHLWLRKIGLYDFCVGITDFAQKEIGEIHLVEYIMQESIIGKENHFGAIHGINKTFSLVAPCDFQIVEMNENVAVKPSHINTDPYNSWFFILSTHISTDEFLTYKEYLKIIK